jgi:hypothetical protein
MSPSIEEAFVLIFQTDTTAHALAIGSNPILQPINSTQSQEEALNLYARTLSSSPLAQA